MPPRVMYLPGLRGGETQETKSRRALIEEVVGPANVHVPVYQLRSVILTYFFGLGLLGAAIVAGCVFAFMKLAALAAALATAILCTLLFMVYTVSGRGFTGYMVKVAIRDAEASMRDFQPNIIIASSFGTVVALSMQGVKPALILLAPGQDNYSRYMRQTELLSISDFPYVIIVHGTCDSEVALDDSVRLTDTIGYGGCKLELIDDYHGLNSLSATDYREFIDEAYREAREILNTLDSAEKERLLADHKVNFALFDLTEGEVRDAIVDDQIVEIGESSVTNPPT